MLDTISMWVVYRVTNEVWAMYVDESEARFAQDLLDKMISVRVERLLLSCLEVRDGKLYVTVPQFMHDCNSCTFLGRYTNEGESDYPQGPMDLYHCKQGGNLPTVLARWSNGDREYLSGLILAEDREDSVANPALKEAKRRARELGLNVAWGGHG